jgi:hypothetical protein
MRSKMILAAAALMALGLGGCAKARKRASGPALAESWDSRKRADPAAHGPAGAGTGQTSANTYPTGGSGGVNTSGATGGTSGTSGSGKSHGKKSHEKTGGSQGSTGPEGSSSGGSVPR